MANCMREADEKREISLLWPKSSQCVCVSPRMHMYVCVLVCMYVCVCVCVYRCLSETVPYETYANTVCLFA